MPAGSSRKLCNMCHLCAPYPLIFPMPAPAPCMRALLFLRYNYSAKNSHCQNGGARYTIFCENGTLRGLAPRPHKGLRPAAFRQLPAKGGVRRPLWKPGDLWIESRRQGHKTIGARAVKGKAAAGGASGTLDSPCPYGMTCHADGLNPRGRAVGTSRPGAGQSPAGRV